MEALLWLIPALPFAGALILIITAGKTPRNLSALIGAGSVVVRDIPADVVAAGNPCRVIRKVQDV